MSKKPKPATVGEKIELRMIRETLGPKNMTLAQWRARFVCGVSRANARRIDAAITRERRRCLKLAMKYLDGEIDVCEMIQRMDNQVKP